MATELLAIAATENTASADFTVLAGASALVYLKDATGPGVDPDALVHLQIKDGTEYFTVYTLTGADPSRRIDGDIASTTTYRWYRVRGNVGVGRV